MKNEHVEAFIKMQRRKGKYQKQMLDFLQHLLNYCRMRERVENIRAEMIEDELAAIANEGKEYGSGEY